MNRKNVKFKDVRVFINRRSGNGWSFDNVQAAFSRYWKGKADSIAYSFPDGRENAVELVHTALRQGADCIIAAGGDGTVSSIGIELMGTDTCLGVIPLGSGNGLARHFSQSMDPVESVKQLASGRICSMDVGFVNDMPFLVSSSMAWDAAIVKTYNKSPVRGVLSYVLAGVVEFFDYKPQPMTMTIDDGEVIKMDKPMLLTIGNLSGWGGGAMIDRAAQEDDGLLELAAARQADIPLLLANIAMAFDGGLGSMPRVVFRKFKKMRIVRSRPHPIQLDGELVDAGTEIGISVKPNAVKVLVP